MSVLLEVGSTKYFYRFTVFLKYSRSTVKLISMSMGDSIETVVEAERSQKI